MGKIKIKKNKSFHRLNQILPPISMISINWTTPLQQIGLKITFHRLLKGFDPKLSGIKVSRSFVTHYRNYHFQK